MRCDHAVTSEATEVVPRSNRLSNIVHLGNTNKEDNRIKLDSNSFKGLQSQSTQKDSTTDKYQDSEGQLNKLGKDISIDYKEQQNQKQNQYSFVSFVMEPSKKNTKSMKQRDKNKPLIDANIITKQIRF